VKLRIRHELRGRGDSDDGDSDSEDNLAHMDLGLLAD
jgi:hypothetical protein